MRSSGWSCPAASVSRCGGLVSWPTTDPNEIIDVTVRVRHAERDEVPLPAPSRSWRPRRTCPPAPEPGGVRGGPRGRPRRPRKSDGLCLRARPLGSYPERRSAERASGGHGRGHGQGVRRRPEALSGRRPPDLPRQRRTRPRSRRPVRHRGGGHRLRHPSPRPPPLPREEGREPGRNPSTRLS